VAGAAVALRPRRGCLARGVLPVQAGADEVAAAGEAEGGGEQAEGPSFHESDSLRLRLGIWYYVTRRARRAPASRRGEGGSGVSGLRQAGPARAAVRSSQARSRGRRTVPFGAS